MNQVVRLVMSFVPICAPLGTAVGQARVDGWTIHRVSVPLGGGPGGDAIGARMSGNGEVVGFSSLSSGYVQGDTNGRSDGFVCEWRSGTIERVTVSTSGAQANADMGVGELSFDGRLALIGGSASNMTPDDPDSIIDGFIRDRIAGTTTLVTPRFVSGSPKQDILGLSMSRNGRYVVLDTRSADLMPGDTNGELDVYVFDAWTRTYELASANAVGEIGTLGSGPSFISPDGRTVAFTSDAYNFLPGYGHTFKNRAYVKRLDTGAIEALYQNPDGTPASGGASGEFELSTDGRYVAFETLGAAYPHESGPKGVLSLYLRDMHRAIGKDVGVTLEGGRANHHVDRATMSADARFFAMSSWAKNLSPTSGPSNDVFVRDDLLGIVSMVNFGDHGQLPDGALGKPQISDDGRVVAFDTNSNNLVPGDGGWSLDVYVVARDFAEPAHYCNTLPNADGCATRIDATDLECPNRPSGPQLVVADAPANSRALLFYGTAGGDITPLGSSGWLCVRPPLAKLALVQSGTSASCGGRFAFDFGAWIDAGKDPALVDGTRVCLQFWVSDPTGATHGVLTDALAFRIANAKR